MINWSDYADRPTRRAGRSDLHPGQQQIALPVRLPARSLTMAPSKPQVFTYYRVYIGDTVFNKVGVAVLIVLDLFHTAVSYVWSASFPSWVRRVAPLPRQALIAVAVCIALMLWQMLQCSLVDGDTLRGPGVPGAVSVVVCG